MAQQLMSPHQTVIYQMRSALHALEGVLEEQEEERVLGALDQSFEFIALTAFVAEETKELSHALEMIQERARSLYRPRVVGMAESALLHLQEQVTS